ncbi:hypothetical protein PMIN07_008962 [Paraphaeosphaeria minitans]
MGDELQRHVISGPSPSDSGIDDAEKGMSDSTTELMVPSPFVYLGQKGPRGFDPHLSPVSPIHEGITPLSSVPELSLSRLAASPQNSDVKVVDAAVKKSSPPKPMISKRIMFDLWFNTYRKFFTLVTLLNLTGIILAALGRFPYAENHLGALVLGNLLTAILFRNELFLRFLYFVFIHGLRSWAPLPIKYAATSILQHVGGIHSGCALSGAAWLIFKVVDIIRYRAVQHTAVLVSGIITNIFIIISVLSAFPWIRNTYHNVFEKHHRFIGWLGLATTWIFVVMGNVYDIKTGEWRSDANILISSQELWFAVFMTVFILIPWVTLRQVPVEVEIPSPKVAVLRFQRGMQQGLLGRISRTSIMEYHAFGIISEGRDSPHHYMICGVQGDFTRALVAHPPKTVWTRELKFGTYDPSSLSLPLPLPFSHVAASPPHPITSTPSPPHPHGSH